jgi:RNA polymerase-interacting CarD/CdnL/TRCF family regulator
MSLKVGSKVIYPSQGPCLIGSIVQKEVGNHTVSFYQLALLDESGGQLFVPVENAQAGRLRQLLRKSEVSRLLDLFNRPADAVKDWKQRASENAKRLASGSAFDLAEIIKSLTELSSKKELSFPEGRVLDKARRLLICELAEVLKVPKSAAEAWLDQALKMCARTAQTDF